MSEPLDGSAAQGGTTEGGETGPTPPAFRPRVGYALHRRTWRAMWWVAGVWSTYYAVRHWLGDTNGHELARHVVQGFVGVFCGIGINALVLLPLVYLGTCLWRGVLRRRSATVRLSPEALARDYISLRRVLLLFLVTCIALLAAAALVARVAGLAYGRLHRSRPTPVVASRPEGVPTHSVRELRRLWRQAIEDPQSVPDVKPRMWEVLRQHGKDTPEFLALARTSLHMQLRAQELFWEDAAVALSTGRPYKSPERDRVQRELLEQDFADEEEVAWNDALIERIAAGEPVLIGDQMMLLTPEVIEQMIALAPARRAALDELLTPPEDMHIE